MSELKEHQFGFCDCDEVFSSHPGPLSMEVRPYYLKSEADKVIDEKDKEIAELKSDIADLRDDKKSTDVILDERNATIAKLIDIDSDNRSAYYKDLAMMAKDVAHQKYKRCLAMAKICENKLGTVVKPGWWDKWRRRWLELAQKFKEAK